MFPCLKICFLPLGLIMLFAWMFCLFARRIAECMNERACSPLCTMYGDFLSCACVGDFFYATRKKETNANKVIVLKTTLILFCYSDSCDLYTKCVVGMLCSVLYCIMDCAPMWVDPPNLLLLGDFVPVLYFSKEKNTDNTRNVY